MSTADTETEKDVKALADELRQLREEFAKIGQLLEQTARHAGDEATHAAREAGEMAWLEVKNRVDKLTQRIEEKPVASTATAFGIGIVIGLLFSGRR